MKQYGRQPPPFPDPGWEKPQMQLYASCGSSLVCASTPTTWGEL